VGLAWGGVPVSDTCACPMGQGQMPCQGCAEPRQLYCAECDAKCMHVGVVQDVVTLRVSDPARARGGMVSRSPEPPLDEHWPELRKLRWLASLVMSRHPGIVIRIKQYTHNFNVILTVADGGAGRSMAIRSPEICWATIDGIDVGLGLCTAVSPHAQVDPKHLSTE
jgi:hypothetical protein